MKFKKFIVRNPEIKNGVPILKGTQITLKTVLGHLILGESIEKIIQLYPELTPESVKVVISYAAAVAEMNLPSDPVSEKPKGNLLTDIEVYKLLSTVNFEVPQKG